MDPDPADRLARALAAHVEEIDGSPGDAQAGPATHPVQPVGELGSGQPESQRSITGSDRLLPGQGPGQVEHRSAQRGDGQPVDDHHVSEARGAP